MRFLIAVIVIIIILFIILLVFNKKNKTEQFLDEQKTQLEKYYYPASHDIKNYLPDKLVCHPSCCSNQLIHLDGLNANQIQQKMSDYQQNNRSTHFVKTNLTCGGGSYGTGCPCLTQDAYLSLANRGQTVGYFDKIEPTYYSDIAK